MAKSSSLIPASLLLGLACPQLLLADWRDDCGYTRLSALNPTGLPSAPSAGFSQIEANETQSPAAFLPDFTSPLFAGKTFTNLSPTTGSGISQHATHVARNFFGTSTSLITGDCQIDNYSTQEWIYGGFLRAGVNAVPLVESRAIQNHSWVAPSGSISSLGAQEINRRLDFAINRDGFVCVVGSDNNAGSTVLPQLLGQSYHTISVGRDDGFHSAGLTDFDTTGRSKPDLVAPSADPEYATSWTTPMVASAAGLLYSKLAAAPYSLSGANLPRVIKSLLLASATKTQSWTNTSTSPLDAQYGAGILNIYHAYQALVSGPLTASPSVSHPSRGWAAETVSGNSSNTYFFTIPAGAVSTPFRTALTWHRSVSKSGRGVWNAILTNLNLQLYAANGSSVGNLLSSSLSAVDNVEFIDQAALSPGDYALVVENTSNTATPYALAWHSLPTVRASPTQPVSREIDSFPAIVTLTRTGSTALPLLVPLSYSGTAIAGTHYTALPSTLTIPAGQSSATLEVSVISDLLSQGNRTLNVSVGSDFGLVRDPLQAAQITLEDKPYDAWRFAHFNPSTEQALSLEQADPDGDGIRNLLEYALGQNPRMANSAPVSLSTTGGYLTLSVMKNPLASDLDWSAEACGDLSTWQSAVVLVNTSSQFTARDSQPESGANQRFLRYHISRRP
jgi:hypothetical protein